MILSLDRLNTKKNSLNNLLFKIAGCHSCMCIVAVDNRTFALYMAVTLDYTRLDVGHKLAAAVVVVHHI